MNTPHLPTRTTVALLTVLAFMVGGCGGPASETHDGHAHGNHGDAADPAPARGPHGGRLLTDGALSVELTIAEDEGAPEYRAWVRRDGQALPPESIDMTVTLTRLDGEVNRYAFSPRGDFLRSQGVVHEPHSFDVQVEVRVDGAIHTWAYGSYEGRVQIAADRALAAGIAVEAVGPRSIHDVLPLYGRVAAPPGSSRSVSARFPGLVQGVTRAVGDQVRAGEVLARIESNDSLQVYTLNAPISGTVTMRAIEPGEQTGERVLFTIQDLTQRVAELTVFPRDLGRLQPGQRVRLRGVDDSRQAEGRILRLGSAGIGQIGAIQAWASVDSTDPGWPLGLPLSAEVLTGGAEVPLAVRRSALQAFRDFTVVFARVGDIYEVRPLELGRHDGEYVEVLSGLKPGAEYVTTNSYLIKADIEKSGASHDH